MINVEEINSMKIYRLSQEKFKKSPVPHIPLQQKGGLDEGRKREETLCNAIRKLAEEWNVGPIDHLFIDSRGDIMMLQAMINPNSYENPKEIDSDLVSIAVEYAGYGPGISDRWIKMNHFIWEKMLGDMGLLPRHAVGEEEFLKEIGK